MAEPFHGGELEAVVVSVRASGELRHRAESWIGRLQVSSSGFASSNTRSAAWPVSNHAEFVQLSEKQRRVERG